MGSRSPTSSRSTRSRTRTTRTTCAPSATASATPSTIRGCRSTRSFSTRSTAVTSRRRRWGRRSSRTETATAMPDAFAICVGTFYEDLAERLLNGAVEGFDEGGVSAASIDTFEVPGAYELPLAAKWCAEAGRFSGVACLGAVIRGETDHYDYVCAESARGIMEVQLATRVPCAFGV